MFFQIPMIMSLLERVERDQTSDIRKCIIKCKDLARTIKTQRFPKQLIFNIGQNIPPEPTARELVEAYFRTFEKVYRVIHVPSFWRDYRNYWNDTSSVSQIFILQLQLCMAIGTCFQENVAELRQPATQWIYEAQFWLMSPWDKSRLSIPAIQVMCLLHLARDTCGVGGGDVTWIAAGSLLRTAMYMGLHRDPSNFPNKTSVHRAEMLRRLWATVLEITLQSSLDSGGPPLISLSDFDTRPPENLTDDQLSEDDRQAVSAQPANVITDMTIQIALMRSFPTRLAVAQFVNQCKPSASYEETLRWNSELNKVCRTLASTLKAGYDAARGIPGELSLFQVRMAERMVYRFSLALNHPWLGLTQHNPAYFFARKMCVETSIRLYRAFATGPDISFDDMDDFERLAISGAGAFRSVAVQSILTMAVELLWQVLEERSFHQTMDLDDDDNMNDPGTDIDLGSMGSVAAAPREILYQALQFSIGFTERRIRAGETNMKGYMCHKIMLAQVDALQRGASDVEIERVLWNSLSSTIGECWELMKELAGETSTPSNMSDGRSASQDEELNDNPMAGMGIDEFGLPVTGEWDWEDLVSLNFKYIPRYLITCLYALSDAHPRSPHQVRNQGFDINFNFSNVDPGFEPEP
jgi:hypothetical protein